MKRLTPIAVVPIIFAALGTSAAPQAPAPAANSAASSSAAPPQKLSLKQAEIRAQVLMAQKDYAAALGVYQQILQQDPKNAKALNQMGIAYQHLGGLDTAAHYYKKAMHADRKFSSPINNLGTVEFEKKHYDSAINYYKKALVVGGSTPSLDLSVSTLYMNLGCAYFANEQYPMAMDSFSLALSLDPHAFEAGGEGGSSLEERSTRDPGLFYFLIAKTYAKKGDAERAAHYLKVSRDDGYEKFRSAATDPDFSAVINDPRVQDVLQQSPSYAPEPKKSSSL